MNRYLLLFLLCFLFVGKNWAQSSFFSNESYWERSYIMLEHVNDLDILLNTGNGNSNDVGYTSGFLLKAFINQKEKKNRLVSFGISTDLFTERDGSFRFDETGRYYVGERFTEISTAEIAFVKFQNDKWAIQYGGGIGLLNKEKPVTGLALWIQGGSDGAGGVHGIIHNMGNLNHGQINVSRDCFKPFLYVNPAVSRYFHLPTAETKLPHTFVTELGVNLCTNFDALWLSWENDLVLHLLQFPLFKSMFDFQILTQGNFKWHTDGLNLDAALGAQLALGRFSFGYKASKQIGDAHVSWVDYADDEPMFSLFLKVGI